VISLLAASRSIPTMYTNRVVPLTAATSSENRILQEPALSTELQHLANPISVGGGNIDAIDFQPCQLNEFRTQDRKCIEHWQMASGGGTWVFTAIFDGQCKYLLVEHAFRTLPSMIKQALESLLRSFRGHGFPAAVSGVLSDCITRFDHSITAEFTRMFPGGPAGLQSMSRAQIRYTHGPFEE